MHSECNTPECEHDKGDCTLTSGDLPECEEKSPDCLTPWLKDGKCNTECNNVQCQYDMGDCPTEVPESCQADKPQCRREILGDGRCDQICNSEACAWDWADCQPPPPTCLLSASDCEPAWLGDGECDPECYTKACNYDNGDCQKPAPCATVGTIGVGAGVACVFPFRYRGIVYDMCATVNSEVPWCSTQISSRGEHVKDQWGECKHSCAVACFTNGTAGSGAGQKCEFPFMYGGIRYDSCTTIDSGIPWCSTKTGDDWGYLQGEWGECASGCKRFSAAQISSTQKRLYVDLLNTLIVMGMVMVGLGCTACYMQRRIKQLGVGNAPRSEYAQKIGNSVEDAAGHGKGGGEPAQSPKCSIIQYSRLMTLATWTFGRKA